MSELVIKAEKLCCQSGLHYLLKDVDWEVRQGEHWIVFGLNGSGKTTLLSAIAGYKQPTEGKLEVLGEQYNDDTIFTLSRQIGWISASFFDKYYSGESVLQIVLSGLFGTLGISNNITDADVCKAKDLMRQWKIAHKSDMPFSMLSKGEQQNVLITRAMMADPKILVLDEPGTGLDVLARDSMMERVRELAETTDITIIYVTHYPEEIQDCFDRCLLMQNGKIIANGEVAEIFNSAQLSKLLQEEVEVQRNPQGTISLKRKVDGNGINS
ncbi:MAG: ATP-binding cassette domain-containing protein [Peptococcaceae bacterium]|nr:ATP-binding cassette domain-containing protein [Peptococcaceae bacterium]MBO5366836.1 ATP-binding cassette domain-containing protein [Peptococcaceae bacterium]MBP3584276.1 ATP-binding cassette domain-containing protein [Peptococcaceae bacterium]